MTTPRRPPPPRARAVQIIGAAVAGLLVLLFMNSVRGSTGDSGSALVSQSVLTLPLSERGEPTATPIPTTAPLQVPTATPPPTTTPIPPPEPTATSAPTPTATTAASEPAETDVSVAGAGTTVDSADAQPAPTTPAEPVEPAPTEPPAPEVPTPTATFVPTPTVEVAGVAPEPTATATPEPTPTATPIPVMTIADLEAYVLIQINQVRANAGLGPVALDPRISEFSRDWSRQMAVGGFFEHRPNDQINTMLPPGWKLWGENIASAPDIFYAQSSLEDSPGHYANMVGSFTHVGIGVYRSQSGQVWLTQNFARY